ncbi:ATP-binding cassette domain-containing protein [Okibacterium endophyticum]
MTAQLLRIDDLTKTYAGKRQAVFARRIPQAKALDAVSLDIERQEVLALVGESGSGKSTLARVLTRLTEPDHGTVRFDDRDVLTLRGRELTAFRRRVQMVFQNPYASLNPRRTVGQAVSEPAIVHQTLDGRTSDAHTHALLERVGLSARLADRLPRELSGGQRQRVAIARALSVKPELLIADEAVSALDLPVQAQILNLLTELRDELGISLLFVSHQLPVVSHIADRVAVMYLGRIVETGTVADVFARPAHPYTIGLMAAQPGRNRRQAAPAVTRTKEIPVVELQTVGCPYRDRCPLAVGLCETTKPPMVGVGDTHRAACHFAGEQAEAQTSIVQPTKA